MTDSFERFCSFNAMYDSSYRVCRNVRWKDSVIKFEENRIDVILQTEKDLRNNEESYIALKLQKRSKESVIYSFSLSCGNRETTREVVSLLPHDKEKE